MIKVTVLYGHPKDPEAFEKYYSEIHGPIAVKMNGLAKVELTRFLSGPDGDVPAYYRMAELYFAGPAEMVQTLGSPEGQATTNDLSSFATGGVTLLIGTVEN